MNNASIDREYGKPRVLVFSQRNIFPNPLFRCPQYEFEDVVSQIDSVEVLAPHTEKWFDLRNKIAKQFAWHSPITLNPGILRVEPKRKERYDLFFAVCGSPTDLLIIDSAKNWRDWAKTSVCVLDELWVKEISACRYFLKILSKFDYVMLYYSQSVKPVGEAIGRKTFFLPPGIDAFLFCPYPAAPKRVVDVYSIGRRSEGTHQKLLTMVKEDGIFYLHDSIAGGFAINSRQHRALLANTAKRSRYFIVNPGLIDRPDIRGNQIEIGNRYFEGAGSGAIMIGERPDNEEFAKLFDWPDAVQYLRYGSDSIDAIIHELDAQPDRQEEMRRNNVAQSLMRHDWAYRWETVLKTAGLEPMPNLLERKERLKKLAKDTSSAESEARPVLT
jgi:hypothetical protein